MDPLNAHLIDYRQWKSDELANHYKKFEGIDHTQILRDLVHAPNQEAKEKLIKAEVLQLPAPPPPADTLVYKEWKARLPKYLSLLPTYIVSCFYNNLPKAVRDDKDVIKHLLRRDPDQIQYINPELYTDREFVKLAASIDLESIAYMHDPESPEKLPKWADDPKFVEEICRLTNPYQITTNTCNILFSRFPKWEKKPAGKYLLESARESDTASNASTHILE